MQNLISTHETFAPPAEFVGAHLDLCAGEGRETYRRIATGGIRYAVLADYHEEPLVIGAE